MSQHGCYCCCHAETACYRWRQGCPCNVLAYCYAIVSHSLLDKLPIRVGFKLVQHDSNMNCCSLSCWRAGTAQYQQLPGNVCSVGVCYHDTLTASALMLAVFKKLLILPPCWSNSRASAEGVSWQQHCLTTVRMLPHSCATVLQHLP